MDILTVFSAYMIPMILVGLAMELIKGVFIKGDKFKSNPMLREYLLVVINLIVSAVLTVPFCIVKVSLADGLTVNQFDVAEYFKAIFIVALASGKVYDIFKKQFNKGGTDEQNPENSSMDKK